MNDEDELLRDLAAVLNKHGIDNECSTPDFILAEHVVVTLAAYAMTVDRVAEWRDE